MIPARKSAAFIRWFSRHVEKRVHRDLQRVQIRGLDAWQAAVAAHPVLLVSNHVSWWDVMLGTYFVHRVIPGCDAFGMMDVIAEHTQANRFGAIDKFGRTQHA